MAICELEFPDGLKAAEFDNPTLLAEALANHVADLLTKAINSNPHGVATLVVSGGKSPVAFFQALSKKDIEWSRVAISLADERWVPTEHVDSNAGLVKRYLFQGPAAEAGFFSLYRATNTVDEAAAAADSALKRELPSIDVLVLGMGDDGHTASLFPNSPNLADALDLNSEHLCLPMLAPSTPHQRLTMTRKLLATAKSPILSISGEAKLQTLRTALAGDDIAQMPIRAFLNPSLEIYWCP